MQPPPRWLSGPTNAVTPGSCAAPAVFPPTSTTIALIWDGTLSHPADFSTASRTRRSANGSGSANTEKPNFCPANSFSSAMILSWSSGAMVLAAEEAADRQSPETGSLGSCSCRTTKTCDGSPSTRRIIGPRMRQLISSDRSLPVKTDLESYATHRKSFGSVGSLPPYLSRRANCRDCFSHPC